MVTERPLKLVQFNKAMLALNKPLEKEFTEFQRQIATFFIKKVVPWTPIDTGKLMSNWQVGINRRPRSVLKSVDRAAKPGKHQANSSAVSAIVIARATNHLRALPKFAKIIIINNAPHIEVRNKDGGTKGPNKTLQPQFIERAVDATEKKFRRVLNVQREVRS